MKDKTLKLLKGKYFFEKIQKKKNNTFNIKL